MHAVRIRAPGAFGRRARGGGERGVPDGGSLLGGVALRDHGDRQAPSLLDRATHMRGARWAGGYPEAHYGALRPAVPGPLPLLDGCEAPRPRGRSTGWPSPPRSFLPAVTALGYRAQVPGGLRNAGNPAARHYGGVGRGAPACGVKRVTARRRALSPCCAINGSNAGRAVFLRAAGDVRGVSLVPRGFRAGNANSARLSTTKRRTGSGAQLEVYSSFHVG